MRLKQAGGSLPPSPRVVPLPRSVPLRPLAQAQTKQGG